MLFLAAKLLNEWKRSGFIYLNFYFSIYILAFYYMCAIFSMPTRYETTKERATGTVDGSGIFWHMFIPRPVNHTCFETLSGQAICACCGLYLVIDYLKEIASFCGRQMQHNLICCMCDPGFSFVYICSLILVHPLFSFTENAIKLVLSTFTYNDADLPLLFAVCNMSRLIAGTFVVVALATERESW